jgi:hypothetical protein
MIGDRSELQRNKGDVNFVGEAPKCGGEGRIALNGATRIKKISSRHISMSTNRGGGQQSTCDPWT